MLYRLFIITALAFCLACQNRSQQNTEPSKKVQPNSNESNSIKSDDYSFLGDSLLSGHGVLVHYLINKYSRDTCLPQHYEKKDLRADFEGFNNIGDINKDGHDDSVFVLNQLNWCEIAEETGQSYYFTDTTLPRLPSGSDCCHPKNFFAAPDIDEDGIREVGFFWSACSSRYKSVQLYRLKNNHWELVASSNFDVLTMDPSGVKLETLVEKISRNRFRMKNFYEGKTYWVTGRMNK